MNWLEMVKVALEGIWVNKMRSTLTVLGIIIGVTAVIIVVTLGQGGQKKIMTEMESIGSNMFMVFINQPDDGDYERYKITVEECRVLRQSIEGIRALVPVSYASPAFQSKRKKETATVIGTESGYAQIRNIAMLKGRFFRNVDDSTARKIVVIDQRMSDRFFGVGANPVGETLTLGQTPVMVCGVCRNSSGFLGGGGQGTAYIPIQLYFDLFPTSMIYELDGATISKDQVNKVSKQVVKALEIRHDAKGKKVYQTFNMEQELQAANKITSIITMIIAAIAGISLLVGGIGVMNIMLVSVTERTREIGIRIAVGARRKDIMAQFLVEAVVLSLLGGIIGIILGLIGSAAVCLAAKIPFQLSMGTVALAFAFSTAVGIFFGLYPANRAARLDPIDALRYE
ncbi:ABC transporter permease [Syntrophomonas palmitatica]|uniref:ABC transporter permease n=1 Tax=Syntrophomonas palmitatica TaxID=402877 RepID=UPI0006CF6613|nr:ABC transporter permease [Syntrophomonas palmitatica]